jgi:hypothetical protein
MNQFLHDASEFEGAELNTRITAVLVSNGLEQDFMFGFGASDEV